MSETKKKGVFFVNPDELDESVNREEISNSMRMSDTWRYSQKNGISNLAISKQSVEQRRAKLRKMREEKEKNKWKKVKKGSQADQNSNGQGLDAKSTSSRSENISEKK